MPFPHIPRRKRWTLLKFVLVAIAVAGVMFWINQVRNVSVNSSDEQERENHLENPLILPREPQEIKKVEVRTNALKFSERNVKRMKKKNLRLDLKHDSKQSPLKSFQIAAPDNLPSDIHTEQKNQVPFFNDKIMKVTPGLGENGKPVLLSSEEQKLSDDDFNNAAFSVYISDRIALNRSVPDPRHPLCKYESYDDDLPTASVIIIFTNEVWSALLRTIYSVINRSPSHLLHEIILVDDYSDKDYLKTDLIKYIDANFAPSLVKHIRLKERQGLIRARLAGAALATGDVLIFLDSHCEANTQWLEPLLQRIKEDSKAVLCPIIDVIDDKTLEYFANNKDYFQIGGFTWSGHFTWIEIPQREEKRKKSSISPTRSPTMAGGLFAIDRNYFWEIGSYDSGMDIWGGENLEMSFRVWLCGGTLEIVPCSHVGHIFRSFHPYTFPGNKDTHGINTVRAVEVWMDEYKKYFYAHRYDLLTVDYGDVSERLEFKKKLQCKPFKWYLENVCPEKFIYDINVVSYGIVRNPITKLCLDILNRDESNTEPLGLYFCKTQSGIVMNQMFSLSNDGELRREENCAEVADDDSKPTSSVVMGKCHGKKGNQEWVHDMGGAIMHVQSGKCLDTIKRASGEDVVVSNCNAGHFQIWWFENYRHLDLDVRPVPQ